MSDKGSRSARSPRIHVEVTQDLIDTAEQRDSSHCMIAEAVKIACPWARNVSVDLQTIRLTDPRKGQRYTYLTPRIGQIALLDFDAGEHSEPLSFVLRGGQVSKSGWRPATGRGSAAQKAQAARARSAQDKIPARQELVPTGGQKELPDKIGGRTPPVASLSSKGAGVPTARRRAYGLRAMDR